MQYLIIAEGNWMVVKYFTVIFRPSLVAYIWSQYRRLADTLR
jgi:hypothetical protein